MNVWKITDWKDNLISNDTRRTGIRFRYDNSVSPEFKTACTEFAKWLRTEYSFPLRVPVYVKGSRTVSTKDGDEVVGSFFEPFSYSVEPYIRIAVGDYDEPKSERGRDNAIATIFVTLAHEITHYYQWINGIKLTDSGMERQANMYAKRIVGDYSMTRDHP